MELNLVKIDPYGSQFPTVNANNWAIFDHSDEYIMTYAIVIVAFVAVVLSTCLRLLCRWPLKFYGYDDGKSLNPLSC
jgi:hypothetical protein